MVFPRNAVLQFGLIWRWLFEKRFLSSVNSDFVVGNVEMPQGGAFSDTQAMRDRMIQAAEEIKDSYNAQPQFAETGAIDNILGVAGGNKIDLVMQTVNDDLDTEEVAKRLR